MNSIFIPIDFSSGSTSALKMAVHLAEVMKKRLVVCHVYSLSTSDLANINTEKELDALIKGMEKVMLKRMLSMLSDVYKNAGYTAVPARTRCIVSYSDQVAEKIVEEAANFHARLIIMGSHGITGFRKALFGSTAAFVIHRSAIPVLTVPERNRKTGLHQVYLASDLQQIRDELKVLLPLTRSMKAHITIVHLQYGRLNESLIIDTKKMAARRKDLSFRSVPADIARKLNEQLQDTLIANKADLLVMSPHKKNFWNRMLLGSKTEDMAGVLQVPLLSLKIN